MNRLHVFFGLVAVLLTVYFVAEFNRPRTLDWSPSYKSTDRIPLGTAALLELLPDLQGTKGEVIRQPIYNQLTEDGGAALARAGGAYLFVTDRVMADSLDTRELLAFADAGGTVLLAANDLSPFLQRALNVGCERAGYFYGGLNPLEKVEVAVHLGGRRYRFPDALVTSWLRPFRPKAEVAPAAQALATDDAGHCLLARVPRGRGQVLLCTLPAAFANYFVVDPQRAAFAWRTLAYLRPGARWWLDEYQNSGRAQDESLLRVVYRYPALRLAFYALLAGVALLLWNGRRRQAAIPVVTPLANTTLQFVGTVASLYRQGDNHAALAQRKIRLFLEFVRGRYHEPTTDLTDEGFRQRLSQKSGQPRADLDKFLDYLRSVERSSTVDDATLQRLSRRLHQFRKL